jgi:hypothetical protein
MLKLVISPQLSDAIHAQSTYIFLPVHISLTEALTHEETCEIVDRLVTLYVQNRHLLLQVTTAFCLFSLKSEHRPHTCRHLEVRFAVPEVGKAGVLKVWWKEGDLTLEYALEAREDVQDA